LTQYVTVLKRAIFYHYKLKRQLETKVDNWSEFTKTAPTTMKMKNWGSRQASANLTFYIVAFAFLGAEKILPVKASSYCISIFHEKISQMQRICTCMHSSTTKTRKNKDNNFLTPDSRILPFFKVKNYIWVLIKTWPSNMLKAKKMSGEVATQWLSVGLQYLLEICDTYLKRAWIRSCQLQ